MSGIAGVVCLDEAEQNHWLGVAGSLLTHRPSSERQQAMLGFVRVAHVSTRSPRNPFGLAHRQGVSVFTAGELYNLPDVARQWLGRGAQAQTADDHAACLAELYRAHGLRPFADLNGAFVLGIWDAGEQAVHLMVDRLGLRKLYYAQTEGFLLFASEVKALLAHPGVSREADMVGLSHFLSLGHLLDDRTLYESVRLLQGGRRLTYEPWARRFSVASYWVGRYAIKEHRRTLEGCADELAARLTTAMARRIQGVQRLAIPLSGGLDSRTVLGFARQLRPDGEIHTASLGHRHTYDVVYARRMARVCRTAHHFVPLSPDFMQAHGPDFVWLTDGMVTAHASWCMNLNRLLPQCADRVLSGLLGDVLNGEGPLDRLVGYREDAAALIEKQAYQLYNVVFTEAELAALLRPEVYAQMAGRPLEDYRRCLRSVQADDMADRAVLAELLQRQQRFTSCILTGFGLTVPVAAPFADNDVVEFLLTMPQRHRVNKEAYQLMIRRYLPLLAHVARDWVELPLDAGRWRQAFHWRWRRWYRKTLPAWTGGRFRPHNRSAYAHYGEWMRQEPMRSYLRDVFRRGQPILAQWCRMSEVERVLDRHLSGRVDVFAQVSALVTLILWFERAQRLSTADTTTHAHDVAYPSVL